MRVKGARREQNKLFLVTLFYFLCDNTSLGNRPSLAWLAALVSSSSRHNLNDVCGLGGRGCLCIVHQVSTSVKSSWHYVTYYYLLCISCTQEFSILWVCTCTCTQVLLHFYASMGGDQRSALSVYPPQSLSTWLYYNISRWPWNLAIQLHWLAGEP